MKEASKVGDPAFVAGCETADVLHSAKASRNMLAVFVSNFAMRKDDLARSA